MKTFTPTATIKSSGALLTAAGIFKPNKRTPWEMQKTVPHEVLVSRAHEERKHDLRELVTNMRDEHYASQNKPKGIFAQTVEGGFKVLGFGVTLPTIEAVKALAQSEGRAFVKVDGKDV